MVTDLPKPLPIRDEQRAGLAAQKRLDPILACLETE